MYKGFMCEHILQVSGTEIDDSRYITNIIQIEQGHIHTPHTRGVTKLTRRLRTPYQWTWLTIEGSATSTLDAWLAVRMTSENNI